MAAWAENAHAKTFRLALSLPMRHLAGQHVVLRLRAPDGYAAQRAYSIASPPDDGTMVDLTVERLPDGEVSTFLHDEVRSGDRLEVRGPLGGHFTWWGQAPALLVAGGAGLVPLMAMLRLARREGMADRLRLVVSARTPGDLLYAQELSGPEEVRLAYTRQAPPGCSRPVGRLRADDLLPCLDHAQSVYVCGSAAFADHATDLLQTLGVSPEAIRVECFGPTA